MKKAEVYNISTGQYQSSSGLLGKTTNIQNIYYCKIINGNSLFAFGGGGTYLRGEPYLKRRWYHDQFSIKVLECKEDDVGAHAAEDQLPAGKLIDHPGSAHTKFYSRNRLLKRVVID